MTTDDTVNPRSEWHPTPAQMQAYLEREVALAKANFARGVPVGLNERAELRPEDTLHSYQTCCKALGIMPARKRARQ